MISSEKVQIFSLCFLQSIQAQHSIFDCSGHSLFTFPALVDLDVKKKKSRGSLRKKNPEQVPRLALQCGDQYKTEVTIRD